MERSLYKYKSVPESGLSVLSVSKEAVESIPIRICNFIPVIHANVKDLYFLLEILGKGTFGCVYRARNKKSGVIRAIKTIKKRTVNRKE